MVEQAADIFGVQRDVAEQIASELRARFPAGLSDSSLASVRLPENLEAYHLYLKGRHAMGQISPVRAAPPATADGAPAEALVGASESGGP